MRLDERPLLPLQGRERELGILHGALADLGSRGASLIIRGEPGLGKSRLVEETLRRARELEYRSAAGQSSELERQRPLTALIDAFSSPGGGANSKELLSLLTGAGPEEVSPAGFDLSYQVIEETLGYLEDVLAEGPLVLVLEDLHWADASTHVFFRHAASRFTNQPLLLIGTRRPWPAVPELDRIEEMSQVRTLVVGPLSEEDLFMMAERALGSPPEGDLLARLRAASGNPLFAQEVVFASTTGDTQEDFARSIVRRLSYLSAPCLDLLSRASVLGTRFRFRDLYVAVGTQALQVVPLVEEAVQSGLLREDGERLRFTHDLVREAIYRNVPAGVRRVLHVEVAEKLASAGAPSAEVAAHYSLGAEPGETAAVDWLWKAAREAAPRSPAVAVDLLTRALEFAPPDLHERDLLLADLVSALLWSGQFYRAELRAQELLERPGDAKARLAVRYSLARVLAYRGRVSESLQQVEAALQEEGSSEQQRARVLADVSLRALVVGDAPRARRAANEAAQTAERLGDMSSLALALCASSRISDHQGRPDKAIALAQRAAAIAATHQSDAIQFVQPALYLGLALIGGDRFAEAAEVLERGRRAAESVGAAWSFPLFHLAAALARFHSGSWDDSLVEAEAGIALTEEAQVHVQVWSPWTRAVMARIKLHRDDLQGATQDVEAARRLEREADSPQFGGYWIRWSEALLHEAKGEPHEAAAALESEWDRWPPDEPVGDHRETAIDMIRLAQAVGDVGRTEQVLAGCEEAVARCSSSSSQATLFACRGSAENDPRLLREAARLFGSCGRLLPSAQSLEAAASCEKDKAADDFRAALQTYESLGANRDVARVEAELRARGIRRGRSGARRRPTHGWESLTDTELNVVALVAEGLTNRQIAERLFISHRTVGTHVSHMLAKLGVSARAELAAEAARRSI